MEKKPRYGDLLLLAKGGDLIQKILVRLPVESLLRLKAVSKSWCSLIESPFFIDLHTTFNSSSSSNKFGSFILLASLHGEHSLIMLSESESVSKSGSGGCLWTSSLGDSNHDQDDDDQLVFKVDNNDNSGGGVKLNSIEFPSDFKFIKFSKKIVGSCNGLICLYDSIIKEVSLWNPATRQLQILPEAIQMGDCYNYLVAFGFDVETKDYKVVLLTNDFRSNSYFRPIGTVECPCRIQVYSLSTNSWRLLEGITCLPGDPFRYPDCEVLYLNGTCFFLAHFFHTKHQRCIHENDWFIISFDFTKYIITPIQLPDHHRHHKLYLRCLGDKMALVTVCCIPPPRGANYYPDIYELPSPCADYSYYPEIYKPPRGIYSGLNICDCEDYNIWVLDEHVSSTVNKESWRQLPSFQIQHQRPGLWSSPSIISNDGKFVLLETMGLLGVGKRMKLYNLVTKEVKKDFLSCSRVMSKAYAYKPSLVKLMVGSSQQQQHQPTG